MNKIGCECESWPSRNAFNVMPCGHREGCPNATGIRQLPITMTDEEVRAILAERKTQTRHVICPQPSKYQTVVYDKHSTKARIDVYGRKDGWGMIAPYQAGDMLWVREKWFTIAIPHVRREELFYKANMSDGDLQWFAAERFKWMPSGWMPKKFARIWLQIVDVRAERIRDISESDAMAEGCLLPKNHTNPMKVAFRRPFRQVYRDAWDEDNAKYGFSWATNPWVWVYTFKKTEVERKK